MEEQLISFKTAKLAKEKGFDWLSSEWYYDNTLVGDRLGNGIRGGYSNKQNAVGCLAAPTQSLLQKWLREKHNIHIAVLPAVTPGNDVKYYIFTGKFKFDWDDLYDTYEEALEVKLVEGLKRI